jgi:ribosome biogenesis protein UTP30
MSSKSGKTPTKKSSKSAVASPKGQAEASKPAKAVEKASPAKSSTSAAPAELEEHNMVNLQQVFRASRALKTHVANLVTKSGKAQLLANESPITVEILLHKVPIAGNMKRKVISLAKPIRDKTSTEICVFVRDSKTAKEKLALASAPNIKKVIALSKLRTHYNQYEARRLLAQSYDLFLCEDTILPDVCHQLGSSFLKIRKAPVPIKLSSRSAEKIAKIRDSTLFDLSPGVTQSYKIGDTGFTEEELVKNFAMSIDKVVKSLPLGWSNVKQIALIAAHCAPLPVYNNLVLPTANPTAATSQAAAPSKAAKTKRQAPSAAEEDVVAPSTKKSKLTEGSNSNGNSATPSKAEAAKSGTPSKKSETPSKKSETTPAAKSETPQSKPAAKSAKTPKSQESAPATSPKTPKASTASSTSTPNSKMASSTPTSAKAKKSEDKASSKQATPNKASTPSTKKPSTPTSAKKK